jgi:hypothetical protein
MRLDSSDGGRDVLRQCFFDWYRLMEMPLCSIRTHDSRFVCHAGISQCSRVIIISRYDEFTLAAWAIRLRRRPLTTFDRCLCEIVV